MTLNISLYDQNQLFNQSQSKSLQNNTYLTNTSNENYKYIKDKFFYTEDDDKAQLLNVGSGIFSSVSDTISYYVWTPTTELKLELDQYVEDYVALWFATIWLYREDWVLKTDYQPAKNYWNDNWVDKILRLYVREDTNTQELYMLVTEYGIWYIENKLYKLTWSSYESDTEVELNTLPQTKDLKPRVDTKLDISALVVVKDDEREQFPISILDKIKSLVYTVDRSIVMQHVQFLQNVESFVLFKGIRRPEKLLKEYDAGKKIDFSMVGRVVNWEEWSSIEFINNTNDLIKQSIEENENNIRRISAMTDIPVEFLWLESTDWAIGANSRAMKHWAFIKRIQWIRELFDKYIGIILEAGKYETEYTRPDVIAKSDSELAEELKTAREIMIISQFEAIKKYNGYNDEQAQTELDKINNESLPIIDDDENKGDTDWEPKEDSEDDQTDDQ